jgi:hypothetical protein
VQVEESNLGVVSAKEQMDSLLLDVPYVAFWETKTAKT